MKILLSLISKLPESESLSLMFFLSILSPSDVFACGKCRYCLADDRLVEAVNFLDSGDGAGWQLLQVIIDNILGGLQNLLGWLLIVVVIITGHA